MKLPFFRSGSPDRTKISGSVMHSHTLRPGQAAAVQFRSRKRKSLTSPKRSILGVSAKPTGTVSSLKKGSRLKRAIKKKNIAIVLFFLIAIGSISFYAYQARVWIVQDVEVNGDVNILNESISDLKSRLQGENLLTLDTFTYTSTLQQDPYVKNLYVEKQYPGKIVINVTEAEPYMNFYSLNTAYLLENNGKVLSRKGLDDNYPVTEVERLVYINKLPFRSDMLKDKWLVENLSKQRDLYLEEQEKERRERERRGEGEAEVAGVSITEIENAEKEDKKKFEKFVDKNFKSAELNSLARYYNQLKSEVNSTIEGRWTNLEGKVAPEQSKFVVYSLIELNEVNGFEKLVEDGFFVNLTDYVGESYIIERVEIISPITVRLKVKTIDGRSIHILFSTRKSLERQFIELNTVSEKLAEKNQKFEKIDLTGDKVVVQY